MGEIDLCRETDVFDEFKLVAGDRSRDRVDFDGFKFEVDAADDFIGTDNAITVDLILPDDSLPSGERDLDRKYDLGRFDLSGKFVVLTRRGGREVLLFLAGDARGGDEDVFLPGMACLDLILLDDEASGDDSIKITSSIMERDRRRLFGLVFGIVINPAICVVPEVENMWKRKSSFVFPVRRLVCRSSTG
jgi:hypothetical protein